MYIYAHAPCKLALTSGIYCTPAPARQYQPYVLQFCKGYMVLIGFLWQLSCLGNACRFPKETTRGGLNASKRLHPEGGRQASRFPRIPYQTVFNRILFWEYYLRESIPSYCRELDSLHISKQDPFGKSFYESYKKLAREEMVRSRHDEPTEFFQSSLIYNPPTKCKIR